MNTHVCMTGFGVLAAVGEAVEKGYGKLMLVSNEQLGGCEKDLVLYVLIIKVFRFRNWGTLQSWKFELE